jgi:4-hydroxy-tetrahydrodipicolinate synthase
LVSVSHAEACGAPGESRILLERRTGEKMKTGTQLRGVFAAVLTPFDVDLRPDAAKAVAYYWQLLSNGCDGLNVLGTTGEAMSVGLEERVRFMEAIAAALPRERMMTGTGAAALADAVRLTRAAFDLGFAAALVIPPFYYRDAGDEGIFAFFSVLFERTSPPPHSVVLYNFPRMSGITFHPDLVDRLVKAFPGIICGVKDSSNTLDLEREIHRRHPELAVFPGSEVLLDDARTDGFAGCISGSVCLWPQLAARVWRDGLEAEVEELVSLRQSLAGKPLIEAVRRQVAQERGDPSWLRSIPPL